MVQADREHSGSRSPKGNALKAQKTSDGSVPASSDAVHLATNDSPMLEMPSRGGNSITPTPDELSDMVLASMQDQAGSVGKSIFSSIEKNVMGLVHKTVTDTMGAMSRKVDTLEPLA